MNIRCYHGAEAGKADWRKQRSHLSCALGGWIRSFAVVKREGVTGREGSLRERVERVWRTIALDRTTSVCGRAQEKAERWRAESGGSKIGNRFGA